MSEETNFGSYSKSHVTCVPINGDASMQQHFKETILRFPEEGVYIYSFKEGRMLYADGWEDVLGYKNEEVTMLLLMEATVPEFAPFSNELNDKALYFIQQKRENLEAYSFSIELKKFHKDGSQVPLIARVGVFSSEHGQVTAIIGRYQINRSLTFGKVMRYAAFGPDKDEFEEVLNRTLFSTFIISRKEKEALAMVARGMSFKEIAYELQVSHSAIEKRIIPMYKRFDVKSLTHLVSFAYDNKILP
jgi:DNA-binding CsgD family transcriptional regulator